MKVFVTGATGFVGSAVVQELIRGGHEVTGLARSENAALLLEKAGAKVHPGDLEDLESLTIAARASEGIIHTGFIHDFSRFKEVCEVDRKAILTMGAAIAGTQKPFIITAGTASVSPGKMAFEHDVAPLSSAIYPRASEETAAQLHDKGIRTAIVRLSPSVHGSGDHGFVPMLINLAREKGVSAYIGEGLNRWSAVHRLDAAILFRLALEKASGGEHFHGVAEEGIPFKEIALTIGKHLNLPVRSLSGAEATSHFGFFEHFAGIDCPSSNNYTRERLAWTPKQIKLLEDLEVGGYF